MSKDRTEIDCKNCKFWSFDMDMEPFCVHKNAGVFGTNLDTMRGEKRSPNMRGAPCGPTAKFFKHSTHRCAGKELNA